MTSSIEKAKRLLGYQPSYSSLAAVEESIAHYFALHPDGDSTLDPYNYLKKQEGVTSGN